MAQLSDARLIGGWELFSIESKSSSSECSAGYFLSVAKLVGMIMCDSYGNMSVQFSLNLRTDYTLVKNPVEVLNGYVAYYANYEVNGNRCSACIIQKTTRTLSFLKPRYYVTSSFKMII